MHALSGFMIRSLNWSSNGRSLKFKLFLNALMKDLNSGARVAKVSATVKQKESVLMVIVVSREKKYRANSRSPRVQSSAICLETVDLPDPAKSSRRQIGCPLFVSSAQLLMAAIVFSRVPGRHGTCWRPNTLGGLRCLRGAKGHVKMDDK